MVEHKQEIPDKDKIVREVHSVKNIEAKTDLTSLQIETINKLKTWGMMFNAGIVNLHIKDFMILQKSKDRKSMAEFVEALKSKKEEYIDRAKGVNLFG